MKNRHENIKNELAYFYKVQIYNVSATPKKIVTQRENSCKLVIARQA